MRKSIKLAIAALLVSAPAVANAAPVNLENPLYLPGAGNVYSKTSAGVMYKTLENNLINKYNGTIGDAQFPIWRVREQLGVGITDRFAVQGAFGYTANPDGDRNGMSEGRVGLIYRLLQDNAPFVLDIYADAHLGGVTPMKMDAMNNKNPATGIGFHYNNYTTGQYGVFGGMRVGHTFENKVTFGLFSEFLYTLPGDNTRITTTGLTNIAGLPYPMSVFRAHGLPDSFSVNLKQTWDWNTGLNLGYEIAPTWTTNFALTWKHHAEHTITKVNLDPSKMTPPTSLVVPGLVAGLTTGMNDAFDEFIFGLSVAKNLTDNTQLALYAEYTADNGQWNSVNTTRFKGEIGARFNVQF
ncbi:MAG: hypothetical protein FWC61_02220 [Proteobacteria bacterium]|nr:hypothetical protein [Pseudomonadota bacterium]